jgi:hypothetical protein
MLDAPGLDSETLEIANPNRHPPIREFETAS